MPIWLRKFTFSEIQKYFDKQKEEQEKSLGKNKKNISGLFG